MLCINYVLYQCLSISDSVYIELSNVLYLMYLGKCNLYGEVIEFRKREKYLQNLGEIINWLQDLRKLSEN